VSKVRNAAGLERARTLDDPLERPGLVVPLEQGVAGVLAVRTPAEEVVGQARGVRDQVPHGDPVAAVDAGHHVEAAGQLIAQVALHRIVEADAPL